MTTTLTLLPMMELLRTVVANRLPSGNGERIRKTIPYFFKQGRALIAVSPFLSLTTIRMGYRHSQLSWQAVLSAAFGCDGPAPTLCLPASV